MHRSLVTGQFLAMHDSYVWGVHDNNCQNNMYIVVTYCYHILICKYNGGVVLGILRRGSSNKGDIYPEFLLEVASNQ